MKKLVLFLFFLAAIISCNKSFEKPNKRNVVSAGADVKASLPTDLNHAGSYFAQLNASKSNLAGGIVSYSWSLINSTNPANNQAVRIITSPTTSGLTGTFYPQATPVRPIVDIPNAFQTGKYSILLTLKDIYGHVFTDSTHVTIIPFIKPTVEVSANQTVYADSAILEGKATLNGVKEVDTYTNGVLTSQGWPLIWGNVSWQPNNTPSGITVTPNLKDAKVTHLQLGDNMIYLIAQDYQGNKAHAVVDIIYRLK